MAYGRVNVGRTSVKKTNINKTIVIPKEDSTSEYEIYSIQADEVKIFSAINGDIRLEGEKSWDKIHYRLFLNNEQLYLRDYVPYDAGIEFMEIYRLESNFLVRMYLRGMYASANYGYEVIEREFPLSTKQFILKTSKQETVTAGYITCEYEKYSI